jgi:ribonucleoside-diphosphate reductase alpha chain
MMVWDAMCAALMSTGARRGAMMGTLRCDHPDVRAFIDAKRGAGVLTNFNLSVQVTDAFMAALAAGDEWPLCFPASAGSSGESRMLRWPGAEREIPCRVESKVDARALWSATMSAAYDTAEPGVLFVDRINRANNLYYREHITSTNPCGEIPLPPYGACVLGSINLTALVERPFSATAELDVEALDGLAARAVRFLDNVIDASAFPLAVQREQAQAARRVGLGVTGLGDALLMLGLDYASEAARALAARVLERVRDAAYRASTRLAGEKGPFPAFERDAYLAGEYVSALPGQIRDGIARDGMRNSHLLAIAPTGTISLLANNVSSGIEPVFAFEGHRKILNRAGQPEDRGAVDFAYALWRSRSKASERLPGHFVTAQEIAPEAHLLMQAALQPFVDNSISKTINVPESISRENFASIYLRAYDLGLKGCTVFRPNSVRGAVLSRAAETEIPCCPLER